MSLVLPIFTSMFSSITDTPRTLHPQPIRHEFDIVEEPGGAVASTTHYRLVTYLRVMLQVPCPVTFVRDAE